MPASAQCLVHAGRQLETGSTLGGAGVEAECTLHLCSRLPGGGQGGVRVRPRLQRERWSLYWKETMATQTELLDDITLDLDPSSATGADLLSAVAKQLGWQPVDELLALEGAFMGRHVVLWCGGWGGLGLERDMRGWWAAGEGGAAISHYGTREVEKRSSDRRPAVLRATPPGLPPSAMIGQ